MPEPKTKPARPPKKSTEEPSFPFIAIGASAGGLEALEAFFENVPSEMGAAFVVIQHVSPKGKSMLGEILKKHTRMETLEVEDGMRAQPGHVYLNPPGKDVEIYRSVFHLKDQAEAPAVRLPIDHFFRSLARDQLERAICIILSGTGSDGTLGLRAIKEAGGLALVQDVEQAKYGSMPASAIATDLVDHVLPVERMPKELISYLKHPYLRPPKRGNGTEKQSSDTIQRILALVRSGTGNDLSGYKPKTIRRRIERRMAVQKIELLADYCRFLQRNTDEAHDLFKELLIGVTQFFRDPAAFDALREKVIPRILERKSDGTPVRVWVPGCSSGEEALSLAMMFVEGMEERGQHHEMQIFATDLDPGAIVRARKAEYSESIAADVSEARLKRFFTERDGLFRVKSEIREMIVYAVHNLVSDPPFSHLDLISCRNVLIYMDAALQRKLIPLLHFSLDPDGYLFLGPSETVGGFASHFSAIESRWKIFRAKKSPANVRVPELPRGGETAGRGDRGGRFWQDEGADGDGKRSCGIGQTHCERVRARHRSHQREIRYPLPPGACKPVS
ncbi:MAG: chemotaxis protein CheB [Syntrophobacteraceae bacterium]